jgi:CheY-like chemotaxis protein
MLKILIVDDVQEDLGFLERVLRQCKILNPVHALRSGEECVSFFERSSQSTSHESYLVFIDLIMSPMSGISVLGRLKQAGMMKGSIFVMVSGITDLRAINEGYQMGAHTFVIKPITPEDVLQTVQGLAPKIRIESREDGYRLHWVTRHQTESASLVRKSQSPMLFR